MRVADTLDHEESIRWLEDPDQFEYVRERWAVAPRRRSSVPWEGQAQGAGRKVGEAVLSGSASSFSPGKFRRRVFVVCDHDRSEGEATYDVGAPFEGVDPSTIEPGKLGEQTPRARGEA